MLKTHSSSRMNSLEANSRGALIIEDQGGKHKRSQRKMDTIINKETKMLKFNAPVLGRNARPKLWKTSLNNHRASSSIESGSDTATVNSLERHELSRLASKSALANLVDIDMHMETKDALRQSNETSILSNFSR